MLVLGVDPGTIHLGYGLVDEDDALRFIECGTLEAPQRDAIEFRLLRMHTGLVELIRRTHPAAVAVEEPFVVQAARNSALAVGEARAVALIAAAAEGVPVYQYTPTRVRAAVTSYGAADKLQVQQMLGLLLGRSMKEFALDACDALAVAVCHLRAARLAELEESTSGERGRPRARRGQ